MSAKPEQWGTRFAERFRDPSVVAAYVHRPPYPDALFDRLATLVVDGPRAVLDVGCGPGNIARPFAPRVDRVDAVDASPGMIALGKTLPGGDHPHLHWHVGKAEEIALHPPYALITAGQSLHWFDWSVALPRFAEMLTPNGVLAIVDTMSTPTPWRDAMRQIIPRYSLMQRWEETDLINELTSRGLFVMQGGEKSAPTPVVQSIDDFLAGLHSASSLSRDAMTPEAVAAFDAEVRAALVPHARDGQIASGVITGVVWGKPLRT